VIISRAKDCMARRLRHAAAAASDPASWGHLDPQDLRDVGWPGEVSEVGGWSGGVFNGGAWLEIDGRRADVHYRDLEPSTASSPRCMPAGFASSR